MITAFYCLENKKSIKNKFLCEYSKNINTFNDYVQYYQKLIKRLICK